MIMIIIIINNIMMIKIIFLFFLCKFILKNVPCARSGGMHSPSMISHRDSLASVCWQAMALPLSTVKYLRSRVKDRGAGYSSHKRKSTLSLICRS